LLIFTSGSNAQVFFPHSYVYNLSDVMLMIHVRFQQTQILIFHLFTWLERNQI